MHLKTHLSKYQVILLCLFAIVLSVYTARLYCNCTQAKQRIRISWSRDIDAQASRASISIISGDRLLVNQSLSGKTGVIHRFYRDLPGDWVDGNNDQALSLCIDNGNIDDLAVFSCAVPFSKIKIFEKTVNGKEATVHTSEIIGNLRKIKQIVAIVYLFALFVCSALLCFLPKLTNKLDWLNKFDWLNLTLWVATLCATTYLTYQMLKGVFPSDYRAHLQVALRGGGYSINALFLKALYALNKDVLLISVYIGLLVSMTGVAIRWVLNISYEPTAGETIAEYGHDAGLFSGALTVLSYSLLFISSIYIPGKAPFYLLHETGGAFIKVGNNFLVGNFLTQPWHNSTYIGMRLFALLSIAVFIKIWKRENNKFFDYALLFVLLTLTNMTKPNFIIAFAPTIAIMTLIYALKNDNKMVKRMLIISFIIAFSMLTLVYQSSVVFDSKHGVSFSSGKFLDLIHQGYFSWIFIASYSFPLLVSAIAFIQRDFDDALVFAWFLAMIALFQSLFLQETGPRIYDGNFGWGVKFASLVLYVVCCGKLIAICKRNDKISSVCRMAWGLLFIYLVNGFMYFGLVFKGILYAN